MVNGSEWWLMVINGRFLDIFIREILLCFNTGVKGMKPCYADWPIKTRPSYFLKSIYKYKLTKQQPTNQPTFSKFQKLTNTNQQPTNQPTDLFNFQDVINLYKLILVNLYKLKMHKKCYFPSKKIFLHSLYVIYL